MQRLKLGFKKLIIQKIQPTRKRYHINKGRIKPTLKYVGEELQYDLDSTCKIYYLFVAYKVVTIFPFLFLLYTSLGGKDEGTGDVVNLV